MTVKIVLVGDSNTEYSDATYGDLAAKLQTALNVLYPSTVYDITNSGVGGTTSKTALDNFGIQVTPYAPNLLVFLHGGTNDGYYTYKSTYPTIYNDSAYEARLRSYKGLVDALSSRPLMLFVAAPAHAEASDGFTYHRNFTDTNPLRLIMAALATEWGLPVVNWHSLMAADTSWKADYLVDGVHVNGAAKDALVTGIMSALTPYFAVDGTVINPYPAISVFTIPATSTSLAVPITTLTATDDVGVTGYMITETSTAPLASDAGWSSTPQTEYTFATPGSKILYAWAKDAAGNVSAGVSADVVITVGTTDTSIKHIDGTQAGAVKHVNGSASGAIKRKVGGSWQ